MRLMHNGLNVPLRHCVTPVVLWEVWGFVVGLLRAFAK